MTVGEEHQLSFESIVFNGVFLGCDESGRIAVASSNAQERWFSFKTKVSSLQIVSQSLTNRQKLQKNSAAECIFVYTALQFECRFNKN